MTISLDKCRTNLLIVWLVGIGLLLLLVLLQSSFGHYGARNREAYEWLAPLIAPGFLVVGVYTKEAISKTDPLKVKKRVYHITMGVSVAYLCLLGLVFLIQPFVNQDPLEFLRGTTLILGAFEGIVTAFVGIFFTLKAGEG